MKNKNKIEITVNSVSEYEMLFSGVCKGEYGPVWWVAIALSIGEDIVMALFIMPEEDGPLYMYTPSTALDRGHLFTEEDMKNTIQEIFDNEYYKMLNLLEEVSA